MFNGNPRLPALASLVLLGLLAAGPGPAPTAASRRCGGLQTMYSQRLLRRLRTRLLVAYAQAHARRAGVVLRALHSGTRVDLSHQILPIGIAPQETDDAKLKQLLAYVAANCL